MVSIRENTVYTYAYSVHIPYFWFKSGNYHYIVKRKSLFLKQKGMELIFLWIFVFLVLSSENEAPGTYSFILKHAKYKKCKMGLLVMKTIELEV